MNKLFIEEWLPIEEIGIESQRERKASSALPPLYFLHVWWARRPLIASAAAVLGSLLPAYNDNWPQELKAHFPTRESYRQWFKRLLGILGDPIKGQRLIFYAREKGIKLPGNPYGYPRAFTVVPDDKDLELLTALIENQWGSKNIAVMDSMAGGGSIPFQALRYGFTTYANELNPVASVILKATLDYPARYGITLCNDLFKYGLKIDTIASEKLDKYYPMLNNEKIRRYLWSRTITCPVSGKPLPLSPNWWLSSGGNEPVAVKLICEKGEPECRFQIVRGREAQTSQPDVGTIKKGVANSPWSGESIDGDYIKKEARTGRMGQQLYALSIENSSGKNGFRLPNKPDLEAVKLAEEDLAKILPTWQATGIIPTEAFPEISNDPRPLHYGMPYWKDFFSPRQLLALGTYVEAYKQVISELPGELGKEKAKAIATYLAFAIDKCIDRNCYASDWIPQRMVVGHRFDRHDFSFRWSFAEMTLPKDGFIWAAEQIVDSYKNMAKLAEPAHSTFFAFNGRPVADRLKVTRGNAASMRHIPDASIELVCVDPPYKANVMYAEMSDFFYVWLKRTLGDIYPQFFQQELTNKDDEAVASYARFAAFPNKKELADKDYERKMEAVFKEMHRILKPEGVLTVMFTHKEVDAWNNLAHSLINAGFAIKASWPVHTEFEHSLHQAKKNAASSTILLVCRKHKTDAEPTWWEDIKNRVRQTAREKASEFGGYGIRGADLYISTFGPVLSIISENWPVLTSEIDPKTGKPKTLSPEIALNLARAEVVTLRKQGLLLGKSIQFDAFTDWYLMAWDAFQAREFPSDEARKLALALNLSLEADIISTKRIVTKKQNFVAFQPPAARSKKGLVDPEAESFSCWLDAVHTAMLVYEADGSSACEQFLDRSGLRHNSTFKSCLQAMVNAIPRRKLKGKLSIEEAEVLDNLCTAFFEETQIPAEPETPPLIVQKKLGGFEEEPEEETEEEEQG